GMRLRGGPRRAVLALLWERARLRLRGLNFRERAADTIPAAELLRIDACDTANRRLAWMDVAQGLLFRARHVRLALAAGEPSRIALGLARVATDTVTGGGRRRGRARAVLERGRGPGAPP